MSREDELSALRATFFEEAEERLAEVERLLLELEQDPEDGELIAGIFRAIHSLKSGGGACELHEIANFAHVFENLLDQMRSGRMRVRPSTLNVLLKSTDAMIALVMDARGFLSPMGSEEISRVRDSILRELSDAGIASIPPPTRIVSDDGLEGLVIWDDEPAAADVQSELVIPASVPPRMSMEPVAIMEVDDEPAEAGEGALLESEQLARLIDLSVELGIASAALGHAVSDPLHVSADRVRGLFTEVQAHTSEIESRLAQVRSAEASAISEVVFVCAGVDCYFLPLAAVERYFSPDPRALRQLPLLGEMLDLDAETVPVFRLRDVVGLHAEPAASLVAVLLHTRRGRVALLVDEVRTQTRVVVRPLYAGFSEISGTLGAALYAGAVVLVLDPDALAQKPTHTRALAS